MTTMALSAPSLKRARRALVVMSLLSAETAVALEVSRSRDVAAPPAAVWAMIGGFCDIAQWHPEVESCALSRDGAATLRTLVAKGGIGTLVERETSRYERAMSYAYEVLSGPLPVRNYASILSVAPKDTGSTVTWSARFEASGMSEADALADIEGVYERGLATIVSKTQR